jgi:phosphatidylglycerophosphate synthase
MNTIVYLLKKKRDQNPVSSRRCDGTGTDGVSLLVVLPIILLPAVVALSCCAVTGEETDNASKRTKQLSVRRGRRTTFIMIYLLVVYSRRLPYFRIDGCVVLLYCCTVVAVAALFDKAQEVRRR